MDELELPDLTSVTLAVRDGITLRNFATGDAAEVYAVVRRNIEHLHFMHWADPNYSYDAAAEFVVRSAANAASGESLSLGMFSGDEFIGSIGFVKFDTKSRRTEIGYWIDSNFEGKGIVTDAAATLVQFAFDELGMNRIEIRCIADNIRSSAVARRLGFRQEAHLREYEIRNGRVYDYLTFGLIRSDLPAGSTRPQIVNQT
jgi:ribosomal-protein-serine acetyltransferase